MRVWLVLLESEEHAGVVRKELKVVLTDLMAGVRCSVQAAILLT